MKNGKFILRKAWLSQRVYIRKKSNMLNWYRFKREKYNDPFIYHFVGYCTTYPFYCWPENTRMRISQFLVLPPYKKRGHGSKLYQTIYNIFKARSEICEITVEDPNEEFSDMRDKNDIRHLLENGAFKSLKAPVSPAKIAELCTEYKLTNRQTQRCIEMYLLSNVNKLNTEEYKAYRLQVKQRLYSFNFVSKKNSLYDGLQLIVWY